MIVSAALAAALALTPTYVDGTAGDDHLHGTHGDDVVRGHPGDDHLRGWTGSDVLIGGFGNDVLREWTGVGAGVPIDDSRDVFRGGPGGDTLYVGHHDVVTAGNGDDEVWAYYVDDTDVIDCGPGDDVLHLHQDLTGVRTRGCETILVAIAG
jgi:Ca2+-binding RTX toxin-like protein